MDYLRALRETGVPMSWSPLVWRGNSYRRLPGAHPSELRDRIPGYAADLADLVHNPVEYSHVILHTVPEYWPALAESGKINLGYTAWETDSMPDHWFNLLRLVDKVLVPSSFTRSVFLKSDPTLDVDVVPHIVHPPSGGHENGPSAFLEKFGLPAGNRLIYTINEWNIRKHLDLLCHAFLLAFDGSDHDSDPVSLVIKTGEYGSPSARRAGKVPVSDLVRDICSNYDKPAPIHLVTETLTDEEVVQLHRAGDIYFSMTHGESWGMGTAQAASHGNPVIITGWSGHLDFLEPGYPGLLDFRMEPVRAAPDQRSYQPTQNWAVADLEHAIAKLRDYHSNFDGYRHHAVDYRSRLEPFKGEKVSRTLLDAVESARPVEAPRIEEPDHKTIEPEVSSRLFSFVFGLKPQTEPFHIIHYLCLRSCIEVNRPDKVLFYYHFEPWGPWWERIRPELELVQVDLVDFVNRHLGYYRHKEGIHIQINEYSYAHQADFVRLGALLDHGGVYADMDTIFLSAMPDAFFDEDFVIGREGVHADHQGNRKASLCNALMVSKPGADFPRRWLENMYEVFDGTWTRHSNQEALRLSELYPGELHVVPQHCFYPYLGTVSDLRLLFESRDSRHENAYSIHLWSHLWWDENRRDFSVIHNGLIDEQYVKNEDTTYTLIARQYLD